MKLGKQPKKFATTAQRNEQRNKSLIKTAQRKEEAAMLLPEKGDIKVYLDDERVCPEGWMLARSAKAFIALLEEETISKRITHLSLDWYMGSRMPDGVYVTEWLAGMMKYEDNFLPNLKRINFHSSDRDKAREMGLIIHNATERTKDGSVRLNFGPTY